MIKFISLLVCTLIQTGMGESRVTFPSIGFMKGHIHLLNVVVQFIVFLTLSTLICRGTDISKCLS